jgi:hypothetical protein
MVIVHSFRNGGERVITHSVTFKAGREQVQRKGEEGGEQELSGTVLQSMFSSNFGNNSQIEGFDWEETDNSLWEVNKNSTNTFSYDCGPGRYCTLRQLVGVCGDIEIRTPFMNMVTNSASFSLYNSVTITVSFILAKILCN